MEAPKGDDYNQPEDTERQADYGTPRPLEGLARCMYISGHHVRNHRVLAILALSFGLLVLCFYATSRVPTTAQSASRVSDFNAANLTPPEMTTERLARLKHSLPQPYPLPLLSEQPPPRGTLPGFALVFLTIRGIPNKTLWQRWMEDGMMWLAAQNLETNHTVAKGEHTSDVLRAYIHYPGWMDPSLIEDSVPTGMRAGILKDVAECTWLGMNPCFHKALEGAVQDFDNGQWFMMASADSVPTKSFAEMYQNVLADNRSRFAFAHLYFMDGLPKSANWMLLTRPHAKILAENPGEWVNRRFSVSGRLQAGSDEFAPFGPLLSRLGERFFTEIHPGVIQVAEEARELSECVTMFHCWGGCARFGKSSGAYPPNFSQLRRTGFEAWHHSSNLFLARKVSASATVLGCPATVDRSNFWTEPIVDLPTMDMAKPAHHVPEVLPQVRATAGHERAASGLNEEPWAASFGPYITPRECDLTDFVTWRLSLRSTTVEKPPKESRITDLPSEYKSMSSVSQLHKFLVQQHVFGVRKDIV